MEKDYSHVMKRISFGYTPSEDNVPTTSFLGGNPYVSDDFDYPVEEDGTPLVFFAQIDLSNIPEHIIKVLNIPNYGFLHFYHSDTQTYGKNLDNITKSISKIFYLKELHDEESFIQFEAETLRASDDAISPLEDPDSRVYLSGETFEMMPHPQSIEAPSDSEYWDHYEKLPEKHYPLWLGGYPHFKQDDIRKKVEKRNIDDFVHFLGSRTFDNVVIWGNMGVGSFWVSKSSINDKSFKNHFLYWDCK